MTMTTAQINQMMADRATENGEQILTLIAERLERAAMQARARVANYQEEKHLRAKADQINWSYTDITNLIGSIGMAEMARAQADLGIAHELTRENAA